MVIAFVRARKPLPRRDKWIGERIQARIKHNNWCNTNNSRSSAPSIFDTKRFEIKIWQINLFKELLDPTTISIVTRRPIKVKSRNESNTVRLTSIAFLPPFFLSSYPPYPWKKRAIAKGGDHGCSRILHRRRNPIRLGQRDRAASSTSSHPLPSPSCVDTFSNVSSSIRNRIGGRNESFSHNPISIRAPQVYPTGARIGGDNYRLRRLNPVSIAEA